MQEIRSICTPKRAAVFFFCLVMLTAAAVCARPFVRGTGCSVSEHETIAELMDCFGEPLYTEKVEQYEVVRGNRVVEKTVTIWYYRIDETGFNQPEIFAFHIFRGEIIEIKRVGR